MKKRPAAARRLDYSESDSQSRSITTRVNNLYRMIETKESSYNLVNTSLSHNNIYIWGQNPFDIAIGTGDPMAGVGNRIGDRVTVRGLSATFFVEGALNRSKVYFRIMLLKGPRGASFTRGDVYKGVSGNKMIDQMNTEKYTVLAQKRFNVVPPNSTAASFNVVTGTTTGSTSGTTGSKIVKFWVPGRKFGNTGNLQFENGSTNPKFFDYRWVILAYDWYGTPQDVNNVGVINESWMKVYYKDA